MPRANHTSIPKISLENLATDWEGCEPIRRRVTNEKRLLYLEETRDCGGCILQTSKFQHGCLGPFLQDMVFTVHNVSNPICENMPEGSHLPALESNDFFVL